jgi:thiol-disulfide isomerase/thioredoxin
MTLMKTIVAATLYAAVVFGANPVWAGGPDVAALRELRAGDMRKLAIHSTAKDPVVVPFVDGEGNKLDITAYKGKVVLLNFWATWCAPCRKEMPQLDALQREMGSDNFAVVTVATGRNPVSMIKAFFGKVGVKDLPILRDPKQTYARRMAVLGLPTTVILDRKGREIARLLGEAEWDAPEAQDLLKAVIAADES